MVKQSTLIRKFEPTDDFALHFANFIYNRRQDMIVLDCSGEYGYYYCEFYLGTSHIKINLSRSEGMTANGQPSGEFSYQMSISYGLGKSFSGNLSEYDYDRIWHELPSLTDCSFEEDFDKIFDDHTKISQFTSR